MRYLFFFFILSCTQKYQTYSLVDKRSFEFGKENQTPITPVLRKGKMEHYKVCADQYLFNRNAQVLSEQKLNRVVKGICSNTDFLLDSKITQTWWTTIIYSRSCMELQTHCPR